MLTLAVPLSHADARCLCQSREARRRGKVMALSGRELMSAVLNVTMAPLGENMASLTHAGDITLCLLILMITLRFRRAPKILLKSYYNRISGDTDSVQMN